MTANTLRLLESWPIANFRHLRNQRRNNPDKWRLKMHLQAQADSCKLKTGLTGLSSRIWSHIYHQAVSSSNINQASQSTRFNRYYWLWFARPALSKKMVRGKCTISNQCAITDDFHTCYPQYLYHISNITKHDNKLWARGTAHQIRDCKYLAYRNAGIEQRDKLTNSRGASCNTVNSRNYNCSRMALLWLCSEEALCSNWCNLTRNDRQQQASSGYKKWLNIDKYSQVKLENSNYWKWNDLMQVRV